jgi:hypothetical protein
MRERPNTPIWRQPNYQEILTPLLKRTPASLGELLRKTSLREGIWQFLFPRFVNPSEERVQEVLNVANEKIGLVFGKEIPTELHIQNPSYRQGTEIPEYITVSLPEGIKIPVAAATIGNASHSDYLLRWFADAFHAAFHMTAASDTKPLKDVVIFSSEMFKVFTQNNLGEELPMQVRIFEKEGKTYIRFNEKPDGQNSRIGNVSSSDIQGLYLNAVLRVISDSSIPENERQQIMERAIVPFSTLLQKIYTKLRPENKTVPTISTQDAATRFDRASGSAGDHSYIQLQAWETLNRLCQIILNENVSENTQFVNKVLAQLAKMNIQATRPDLDDEERKQAEQDKSESLKLELITTEVQLRLQIEQHYWITQKKLETLESMIRYGNRENEQVRNSINPFNINQILYKPDLADGAGYFAELLRTQEMSARFVSMANFTQALGGGFATFEQVKAMVKYVQDEKLDLPFPIQAMHPMPNWKEVTVGDDANFPYQNHWGKQARDAAYYILALRIVLGQEAAILAYKRVCEAVGKDLLEWNNALTLDPPMKDHKVGGQTWTITGVLMAEKIANSSEGELLQIAQQMGLNKTILEELSKRAENERDIPSISPKEQAA